VVRAAAWIRRANHLLGEQQAGREQGETQRQPEEQRTARPFHHAGHRDLKQRSNTEQVRHHIPVSGSTKLPCAPSAISSLCCAAHACTLGKAATASASVSAVVRNAASGLRNAASGLSSCGAGSSASSPTWDASS